MPQTKPVTDQTSEQELREQVAYLQFVLLKDQIIDQIRDEIWKMQSSEDMKSILEAVQKGLGELEVDAYNCRVNLVDEASEPPSVLVHAMTQEGSWIDSLGEEDTDLSSVLLTAMTREGYWSESSEPGTDVVIQIWRNPGRRRAKARPLRSERLIPAR